MAETYDLAIVGAGLSAMSFLRAGGARGRIVVVDYADRPGGWLRFALPAPGFENAWDLIEWSQKRIIGGGREPERDHTAHISGSLTHVGASSEGGDVELRFGTMAVGLLPALRRDATHTLLVRSEAGTDNIRARRVVIASGGLEITREHDQIPGSRPVGVVTPVFVHQMLSRGYIPGTCAVVTGDARYATATAARLARTGVDVALVPSTTAKMPAVNSDVRVERPAKVAEIVGFPRLECVRLERDGKRFELQADMLVYARGMTANTLWLKGSGIELQPDGAIGVTAGYETNLPGVFAMGTAVSPDLDHQVSISMGRAAAMALEGSAA